MPNAANSGDKCLRKKAHKKAKQSKAKQNPQTCFQIIAISAVLSCGPLCSSDLTIDYFLRGTTRSKM
jgi:hypothetical protein